MSTYDIETVTDIREGREDAEEKEIFFRCPRCGHDWLLYSSEEHLCIQGMVSRHRRLGSGKRTWHVPPYDYDDDYPFQMQYSCRQCGYVVEHEDGVIFDEGELADWLMSNCPQEDQGTGEQKTE
ncbi:MAG: hypothetical protein ACLQPD_14760 [Desulfomonilaceae bacterium]